MKKSVSILSLFVLVLCMNSPDASGQIGLIKKLGKKATGGSSSSASNDMERMDQSPAKKELMAMHSNLDWVKHYLGRYEDDVTEGQIGSLDSRSEMNKAIESARKKLESAKKNMKAAKEKDPKFKWDRLDTDYQAKIDEYELKVQKVEEEMPLINECTNIFGDLLFKLKNLVDHAETHTPRAWKEKAMELNPDTIKTQIARFEKLDIRKKPYFPKAKEKYEEEFPKWIETNLPELVDKYIANEAFGAGLLYVEGAEYAYPEYEGYDALKEKITTAEEEKNKREAELAAEKEAKRQKKIDEQRVPPRTMNRPSIESMAVQCLKDEIQFDPQILEKRTTGEYQYKTNKYTDRIIHRKSYVTIVTKEEGHCYLYDVQIYEYARVEGSGYKPAECGVVEKNWYTSNSKERGQPLRYEIRCQNVK